MANRPKYITNPLVKYYISPIAERMTANISIRQGWSIRINKATNELDLDYAPETEREVGQIDLTAYSGYKTIQYIGKLNPGRYIAFANPIPGSSSDYSIVEYYENATGAPQTKIRMDIPDGASILFVDGVIDIPLSVDLLEEGYFDRVEVTDDYADAEGLLLVDQTRDDTSSVYVMTSGPLELTGRGRTFINKLFSQYGLYAKGTFDVYKRDRWNIDKYTLVASLILDFQTWRDFNNTASIQCRQSEAVDYFQSKGKVKYDIPVAEVVDAKSWHYQRMDLMNTGNYTVVSWPGALVVHSRTPYRLEVYKNSAEMIPGSTENDIKTQSAGEGATDYFFLAQENMTVTLRMKFKAFDLLSTAISHALVVAVLSPSNNIVQTFEYGMEKMDYYFELLMDANLSITLSRGQKLAFYQYTVTSLGSTVQQISIIDFEYFKVEYITKGQPLDGTSNNPPISVIDPKVLWQKFLDKITDQPGYLTGDILWKPEDYLTKIVAADSIRNFPLESDTMPTATLHGSPNDFMNWMRMLGYELEFTDRQLNFIPRDACFPKDVTALELGPNETADLVMLAHEKFAYTDVQLGYEKQEYDSVNGAFEANGLFQYTTGYTVDKNNSLKFISPYRADSIGIELLCWERDQFTKDTKSDNDVFFVALVDKGEYYEEYRGIEITDTASQVKMFNAPFNPYFLVSANESLIGINAKGLRFTSTDMSRNAQITGVDDIYADRQITKKLFEPVIYNFVAGHHHQLPSPDLRNGLIKFVYHGVKRQGFIQQIRRNEAKERKTEWDLYVVE